ncbi:hypothetical protein ACOSQ2_033080 [Xanthoceras sorbifolium]
MAETTASSPSATRDGDELTGSDTRRRRAHRRRMRRRRVQCEREIGWVVGCCAREKSECGAQMHFLSLVKKQWLSKPQMVISGIMLLGGVDMCNGLLYIANVGDSRLVFGRAERATRQGSFGYTRIHGAQCKYRIFASP